MAQALSRLSVHALLALALLALAATANAETKITYYYGKQGDWITSRQKNSDAACMAILSENPDGTSRYKHVAALQGTGGGNCIGDLQPSGPRGSYGQWVSTTVTCEHGSADGLSCNQPPDPNPCEDKAGQPTSFYSTTEKAPGTKVCANGCQATSADGVCASGLCFHTGTYTGSKCSIGDDGVGSGSGGGDPTDPTEPGNPTDPTDPQEPTDPTDPNDPCAGMPGYSWSGTTCVPDPDGGGDSGGNDGNDGGDTGGNDGGNDNGGNNGGGNSGGGNDGDGKDDDGNNNSGGGGGGGDNDNDGDGDDDKGDSSVGGESCTAELVCEGDVIQCAILRKNKEQVCQWKYDSEVKGQVESELSGSDYQLQDQDIPVSGMFSDALNKGRWLPQSCPAPQTFNVMGRSYSLSWEPACRFALAIGPLIVALASIFFAVTIARGIKGS